MQKRWALGFLIGVSAVLPARAFDAVKPEDVSAGDPYKIKEEALMDPSFLKGIKIAMVCAHGFEEVEATYPLKYLQERSATVDVICPDWIKGRVMAVQFLKPSIWIPVTKNISEAKADDYDAVVIPGGAWNPIIMRTDGKILDFINAAHQKGKLIASVCHGPQVLISAGLVRGRDITGVGDIRKDLRNAGANVYEDRPVVSSGNLITSRDPHDLLEFSKAISHYLHETRRRERYRKLYGE
jgi:protease I